MTKARLLMAVVLISAASLMWPIEHCGNTVAWLVNPPEPKASLTGLFDGYTEASCKAAATTRAQQVTIFALFAGAAALIFGRGRKEDTPSDVYWDGMAWRHRSNNRLVDPERGHSASSG